MSEWVDVKNSEPEDGSYCWVIYDGDVLLALRDIVFISVSDGMPLYGVEMYQQAKQPLPPQ